MFAQGQGDVVAAETEGIAQRKPDIDGFASSSHVVKITLGILIFDIDGRMHESVTQGKRCYNSFDSSSRAQHVSDHRLARIDR